jgi:enamine deaminase RidA (YjgF/YER057c/UK114 family)
MEKKIVNPWKWQDPLGFSQAIQVTEGQRTLYCAGQASMSAEGRPLHEGNMTAQLGQAMDNSRDGASGCWIQPFGRSSSELLHTNIDGFFTAYQTATSRLAAAGCQPASTLLGVARLAFPELMIEIEATALK